MKMNISNFITMVWISILALKYCRGQTPMLTPINPEVIEGSDITLVCTVSENLRVTSWHVLDVARSSDVDTIFADQINGTCEILYSKLLLNTTEYSYDCNSTIFWITVKSVQKSDHLILWECNIGYPYILQSTIKVQVPVSTVSISPLQDVIDVKENTYVEFTCETSEARPHASLIWYEVKSGLTSQINQNIVTTITEDEFSVTISTLRFAPSREQKGIKIFCEAYNKVNTSPIQSSTKVLNVVHAPQSPLGLRCLEDLTTTTSIHLEWKPAYNGGMPQTFHIKYKASSSSAWSYVTIADTDEYTMQYTLTGLSDNTQFNIVIYASNKMGKSNESTIVIAMTKGKKSSNHSSIKGGLVGGLIAVAVVAVAVAIVEFVLLIRRFNPSKDCKTKDTVSTERFTIAYDKLNHETPDSTTYTVLQSTDNNLTSGKQSNDTTYENAEMQ